MMCITIIYIVNQKPLITKILTLTPTSRVSPANLANQKIRCAAGIYYFINQYKSQYNAIQVISILKIMAIVPLAISTEYIIMSVNIFANSVALYCYFYKIAESTLAAI